MIDSFTSEPVAAWLALRLQDARDELAARGRTAFPAWEPYVSNFITAVVEHLQHSPHLDLATNTTVMRQATELGVLRFAQGASVPQVLREHQTFADLLEEFLLDEVRRCETDFAASEVLRGLRCLRVSVRVLQQQTVDAFVRKYMETIERQSEQLIALGRLVGHEMRQPLGVLQLMSGVVPIREGDVELTYLMDVFDRNIRRLAHVAGRLERLSHDHTVNERSAI